VVPEGVRGINFGAILLGPLWMVANGFANTKIYKEILRDEGYSDTVMFSLGSRANELAWRYKRWPSLEAFQRIQTRWSIAGLVFLTALALLPIAAVVLLLLDSLHRQ